MGKTPPAASQEKCRNQMSVQCSYTLKIPNESCQLLMRHVPIWVVAPMAQSIESARSNLHLSEL